MNVPNLTRIVDTYIPIAQTDLDTYLGQLRREVVPFIRKLQSDGLLRWYSFLIHGPEMLGGREPMDGRPFIHFRLEPETGMDINEFIKKLPNHFRKPIQEHLTNIGGLELSPLRDQDWAYAWKLHGEASEWVLCMLESHGNNPIPIQQLIQFLHYITNPLMLGNRCICIPAGVLQF